MSKEAFFLGYPVEFKNLFLIYPPKVKNVIMDKNFGVYTQILTVSQEEIEDDWIKRGLDIKDALTPLEFLLNNGYNDKNFERNVKEALEYFIHEPVTLLYEQKAILIGDISDITSLDNIRLLTEKDFFEFQNTIREAIGQKPLDPPVFDEDPRVRAIKAKARYRDKVKAKSGKGLNLFSSLASICCMDMGLNPLNIGELSYCSISSLISIYQSKEKYEIDIRSLIAGGDKKKIKPEYWIKNQN